MSQQGSNTVPQFSGTIQNQPQSSESGYGPPGHDAPPNGGGRLKFAIFMTFAFLVVFVVGITVGGLEWLLFQRYQRNEIAGAETTQTQPGTRTTTQSAPKPEAQPAAASNDDAKALSDRVSNATPDQRQPLAEALALAEITYAKDYRFPFEHAKLSVAGNEHHHAFGLLYIAAERAIDAGKSEDLLAEVQKEKDGVFYKCSRGHDEWKNLVIALETKDKSGLTAAMKNMHRDLIGGTDDMKDMKMAN